MTEISEEIIRTENKYLAKIITRAVTAVIVSLGALFSWQVDATKANKAAIDELTQVVIESNVSNNNRFNQIDNRINVGRERGTAIVDELRGEISRIWKAIEELKKEVKK